MTIKLLPRKNLNHKKPSKPLTGWSYSAWAASKACGYKFLGQYVLKIKETEVGPALIRGTKMHKFSEDYLKDEIPKLPYDFRPFKQHYKEVKKLDPLVEEFWGTDENWKPTKWNSWVVMKMDVAVEPSKDTGNRLIIIDLKTGREYPEHAKQADLYATIGDAKYPKAAGVDVEYWYVDSGDAVTYEYSERTLISLREYWEEEGAKVLAPQKVYLPTPSEHACRFCYLRSDKQGDCNGWKTIPSLKHR